MTKQATNPMTKQVTKPVWRDDLLACYPALIDRLKACPEIKKVCTARELADLGGNKAQMPLDGAVYVILDSITPEQSNNGGRETMITLGFSIILAKQNVSPTPKMAGLGVVLTAICKALQGFEPKNSDGKRLSLSPFVQEKGLPIRYSNGFGFYAFRFTTTVAVVRDDTDW